jgi:transcriptional regulator with XRE-family HTH domain
MELAEDRGFKKALADRMAYGASAITPYINGSRPVSLDMLEAISEISGKPPAELIAPPGSIHQCSPDEAALLRALRTWPPSVTTSLLRFLAFFADEPPGAGVLRNLHEIARELSEPQRQRVYTYARQEKDPPRR